MTRRPSSRLMGMAKSMQSTAVARIRSAHEPLKFDRNTSGRKLQPSPDRRRQRQTVQCEGRFTLSNAGSPFIYGSVGMSHIPIRVFCQCGGTANLAPTKRRPAFRRTNRGSWNEHSSCIDHRWTHRHRTRSCRRICQEGREGGRRRSA